MKKFFYSHWPLIIIFILSFLITWPVFVPGYFSHHDDLHVMRIFEMRKCFADFQIPCRWVPDMGYGNGYPLFNFYAPLAYYIGALASFVFGYVGAAKLLFFLPLVLGGIGMYLLARELFGKTSGFIAGVLYLFAPYRALDAYVRGAVGESFALALIPFVFYFIFKLLKERNKKYFLWTVAATAAFFTSHNIMTLIFTPLIVFWTLLILFNQKWQGFKLAFLGLLISFGISAFFVLPAFFEKGLVQTEALTRAELDFRAQFVKVSQIFTDRSWNYSGSQPQAEKTISYQIGWPLWWLAVAAFLLFIFRRDRKNALIFGFYFSVFIFAVFMIHNKSAFIWENIEILSFVQFPWRFLSIVIFTASLLGGYFISMFNGKSRYLLAFTFSLLAIFLNWQYFRPEHFYKNVTDKSKLSGENFIDQQKGSLLDYLPKTALEPRELAPDSPLVIDGKADMREFVKKSDTWNFKANVPAKAKINIPVFDFPDWTVYVNGQRIDHKQSFPSGRIEFTLSGGEHFISGKFNNTPIRNFSNLLSLVSLAGLVFLLSGKNKIIVVNK